MNEFDEIYAKGGWDGMGSGPGSTEAFTRGFRAALEGLLREKRIRSVFDAACGDWQWQQHADWNGARYEGWDTSKLAIYKADTRPAKNAASRKLDIRSILDDAAWPKADLVILKDIAHHIPREKLFTLFREANKYPYALWVADVQDDGEICNWPEDVGPPARQPFYEFDRSVEGYRYGRKVAYLQVNDQATATQVVVVAHGAAIETFRRNEKYWMAHDAPILVLCPEDDRVESDYETIAIGERTHNGPGSIRRFHALFEAMERRSFRHLVMHEYDSICLDTNWLYKSMERGMNGFFGVLQQNHEPTRFLTPRYANPPWVMDKATLSAMTAAARKYPDFMEEGEADRWLSAMAQLGGAPIRSYDPPGHTRATLEGEHINEVREAIQRGARMIHGVKHGWMLSAIEEFYSKSKPTPCT